jgi:hypothetical protein
MINEWSKCYLEDRAKLYYALKNERREYIERNQRTNSSKRMTSP